MSDEKNTYFAEAQREQWRGDYAMALQYYRRAIQLEPNRGELYWEMAISLIHLGMRDEAKAAQQKAAELDPEIRAMIEKKKEKAT